MSVLAWGDSAVAPRLTERDPRWTAPRLRAAAHVLLGADATADADAEPGFALRVADSSLPGAGLGVYAGAAADGGGIRGGEVVALYPGIFVPLVPLHARAAARGEPVMDVLHMARLWGYGAIDSRLCEVSFEEGSSYWLILEEHSGLMDGFRPEQRVGGSGCNSPFAVGHLVNHPPRGTAPNVSWQEFDWNGASPLVPNRLHRGLWYMHPTTMEPVDMPSEEGAVQLPLPGVAIVALRDLAEGEELFMDYKLSKPHPPWYSPVAP